MKKKKIINYLAVAVCAIGAGVLFFSLMGVAVFFLPLLGGAFKGQV